MSRRSARLDAAFVEVVRRSWTTPELRALGSPLRGRGPAERRRLAWVVIEALSSMTVLYAAVPPWVDATHRTSAHDRCRPPRQRGWEGAHSSALPTEHPTIP